VFILYIYIFVEGSASRVLKFISILC